MAEVTHVCCEPFATAKKPATDNDACGPLLLGYEGRTYIGWGLKPIAFCPWCGMKVAGRPVTPPPYFTSLGRGANPG